MFPLIYEGPGNPQKTNNLWFKSVRFNEFKDFKIIDMTQLKAWLWMDHSITNNIQVGSLSIRNEEIVSTAEPHMKLKVYTVIL